MSTTRTHPHAPLPRRLVALLAMLAAVALVAGACSDGDAGSGDDTDETTTTVDLADTAAYRGPGPYEVGLTSLSLPDREVAVFYPASDGATEGVEDVTYSQLDALPPELAEAAPALLPEGTDPEVLTVTIDGVGADVAASPDGPFPLVLFSHGFGSFRLDASALLAGIASWGFVVAAPQHIERDRAALVGNTVTRDPDVDVQVLLDTITLVGDTGGPLDGLADTEEVGAVGHSAGGRAVLTALSEPEIDVAVGWAAAGRGDVPVVDKPSMNVAATVDVLVPLTEVEATYDELAPPKRLVVIDGAGHNSFTDICVSVKEGNDLIGLAESIGFPIPENLAAGATDGCEEGSIDTLLGWEVTQHFTVAQLRNALGLDPDPVGLGEGVVDEFDVPIDYRMELDS
jgi:predicted dienelactone hydrolase